MQSKLGSIFNTLFWVGIAMYLGRKVYPYFTAP